MRNYKSEYSIRVYEETERALFVLRVVIGLFFANTVLIVAAAALSIRAM